MSRTFTIRTTEGKTREIAVPAKLRVPLGGKKAKPRESKPAPKPAATKTEKAKGQSES